MFIIFRFILHYLFVFLLFAHICYAGLLSNYYHISLYKDNTSDESAQGMLKDFFKVFQVETNKQINFSLQRSSYTNGDISAKHYIFSLGKSDIRELFRHNLEFLMFLESYKALAFFASENVVQDLSRDMYSRNYRELNEKTNVITRYLPLEDELYIFDEDGFLSNNILEIINKKGLNFNDYFFINKYLVNKDTVYSVFLYNKHDKEVSFIQYIQGSFSDSVMVLYEIAFDRYMQSVDHTNKRIDYVVFYGPPSEQRDFNVFMNLLKSNYSLNNGFELLYLKGKKSIYKFDELMPELLMCQEFLSYFPARRLFSFIIKNVDEKSGNIVVSFEKNNTNNDNIC